MNQSNPQTVYSEYRCLWNSFGLNATATHREGSLFVSAFDVDARKAGCSLRWLTEIIARLNCAVSEYGDHGGPAQLRHEICECENVRTATQVTAANVLITQSATSALFVILHYLSQANSLPTIAIHCPTYYAVQAVASSLRCQTICFDRNTMSLGDTVAQCREASAFVVTNPTFPDGVYISPDDLESAVTITRTRGQMLVIDEAFIYVPLIPNPPIYQCLNEEHVVRVRSFSKMWGFSALRGGCIFASPRHFLPLAESAELVYCRTNKLTNDIYTALFRLHKQLGSFDTNDDELVTSYRNDWQRHVDALRNTLDVVTVVSKRHGILTRKTEAGFSTQVECPGQRLGERWYDFVKVLAKEHQMMVHLDNVLANAQTGCNGRIRLSLGLTPAEMERAINSIAAAAQVG